MNLAHKAYTRAGAALGTLAGLHASTAHAAGTFGQNSQVQISGDANFSSSTDGTRTFLALANQALNLVLLVVGVLAVFYLIYSGFLYITSGGNPDNVKKARAGIINSIIGIVIILAAFVIVKFAVGIGNTIGSTATR